MWLQGKCTLGAHCRHAHTYDPEYSPVGHNHGWRPRLNLSEQISPDIDQCNSDSTASTAITATATTSSKVICIASALGEVQEPRRQKLDLFKCLDLKTPPVEENDADSILDSISQEIGQQFDKDNNNNNQIRPKLFLAENINACFADTSPWSLPN